MAAVRIEYYTSFISLWSYIGSAEFGALVKRHRAEVLYRPIDLIGVFAVSGGLPVRQRTIQRQAYRILEMKRWREIRGIRLNLHPKYYPADPSRGHRMLLAAIEQGDDVGDFVHAALEAVWADELNIEDSAVLRELASGSGLDGRALLDASEDPRFRRTEAEVTEDAKRRQVFGAPFYVLRGEPFWGQDRLAMLEEVISSGRSAIAFGET